MASVRSHAVVSFNTVWVSEEVLSNNNVVGKVPVILGEKEEVEIIPLESVSFLNKKGGAKKNTSYEVKIDKLKAPVKIGEKVGELLLKENENVIRTISVTVKEDIKKINLFELYIRNLKQILKGIF